MTRSLWPLAVLALALGGCSGSTADTSTPDDGIAVTCAHVSFVLDPSLGSDASCEVVPEIDDPYFGHPEFVWIELEGYPVSLVYSPISVAVYPVAEFSAMVDAVPEIVANLEASIGGSGPATNQWGELPFLLNQDQGQFFYAQYDVVPFESGTGIRYLTGFTQDMGVFGNPVLYTYQAMTDDGRYWVSAVFPISHPLLPDDATWPPDGMTVEEFSAMYDTYVSDNVDQLNAQSPGSFYPTIDALDALVKSITITP